MGKSLTRDEKRLLESMERTFRDKFAVRDLVKTWVDDGPKIGIVVEVQRRTSGTSFDILVDGEIHHRPANYVVALDEDCPKYFTFEGFTLPVVRRVYPTLMTNDIVTV